ncbi:MAG: TonB-dependent receptor plug domain-containing protein [Cellvibrio sp.]
MKHAKHPLWTVLMVTSLLGFSPLLSADGNLGRETGSIAQVEETYILGVRERLATAGRLQDVIQRTEVVDNDLIDARQSLNLSQAIQLQPGVRVSNECSMCGAKRVLLNGLRGEHTTILIDGLPLHTMISGFYALDALSMAGVSRLEVARGAGASLVAPEAIGGTVNVVSEDAVENRIALDVSYGQHGYEALQGVATAVLNDGRTGVSLVGQYDTHDQTDADHNGVSEKPLQENASLAVRINHDLNSQNNLQLRVARVESEVFGGPVLGDVVTSIKAGIDGYDGVPSDQLFDTGRVDGRYIGKPWETLEWVDTTRDEIYVKWLSEWSASLSSELAVSHSNHHQASFYEGIDYDARNKMTYARYTLDWQLNAQHLITFGVDMRDETLRSHTEALSDVEDFVSDSFDYRTQGLFIQHTWTPNAPFELASVLRVDQIEADFTAPSKFGTEIDDTVVAPRFDARWFHNDTLTSRLSVGRGYRAPLSFFESEHGILDAEKGFLIDVDKAEESVSVNYALSYEGEKLNATLSLAETRLDHLASLEETADGVPVLDQLDERAAVAVQDIVVGYAFSDQLDLRMSFENYDYDRAFRESFSIAPIEQRLTLGGDWRITDALSLNVDVAWYASRDLRQYGYEAYEDEAQTLLKPQKAPSYALGNAKLDYAFDERFTFYVGGNNLLNYTQVRKSSSPLMYNGGYDVAYIYGPMDEREFYAGFKWSM